MLNLISDPWIPVVRRGERDTIRPDQIAEPDVLRPDWPRPDLNLACIELLIGMTYLACPPLHRGDRTKLPDAKTLRQSLRPLAGAFELLGDGPRFMQDLEPLEGSGNPPDMLFIDSAGSSTVKKNADVMVRRKRYEVLPLPTAAMALYALQAFAPSGGKGNRTSMRGGGPMVALVKPATEGLWPLIWANVPRGKPLELDNLERLPWMRATETSNPVGKVHPVTVPKSNKYPDPEVFFGQPRRIRLVAEGDAVSRVIQKNYGTNYVGWLHPLTPYYRAKGGLLPLHPKPGTFGYRNWRGVILESESGRRSRNFDQYLRDTRSAQCSLVVAGWAMNNMKPLDFLWSEQPVFPLSKEDEGLAAGAVEAAEQASYKLAACVRDGLGESDVQSGAGLRARETFFTDTQSGFEEIVEAMSAGEPFSAQGWLGTMRGAALKIFDQEVIPGLADLGETRRRESVKARLDLAATFAGRSRFAKKVFDPLDLELPARPTKKRRRK